MDGKDRRLRLLYTVAAVAGGIIGGVLSDYARHLMWPIAFAETSANSQVVSAREFRVVDEGGKIRARLFLNGPYEPKLALYDWRGGGDEQVSLAAASSGGQLTLSYSQSREYVPAQQQGQFQLSAEENGGSLKIGRKGSDGPPGVLTWDTFPEVELSTSKLFTSLNLASAKDQKRAIQASVGGGGQVFVLVRDHNGEQRAGLELDNQDNPGFFLYDQNGNWRSRLALNKAGDPQLSFLDLEGYLRAVLNLDTEGNPSLTLNDIKETRAVLGSVYLKNTATGSTERRAPSSLVLFRENGKLLWSAP
jgi:hypothetical protein